MVSIQPPVLLWVIWEKPACPVLAAIALAAARMSSHVAGGLFGSRPAASNSLRLYWRPMP